MTMTTDKVAEIKACAGVYRASDVARHYNVHRSTVTRIWHNQRHADVSPASDFPDIYTPLYGAYLDEEIMRLLHRGMRPADVAQVLGISERTVWIRKGVWL